MRNLALGLGFLVLCGCGSSMAPNAPSSPATPPVAQPSSAADAPAASDQLDAVAWYQNAEEARRLMQSVFAAATTALDAGLADPSWSALDQGPEAAALPPAIIADLDETLLDNSALQVRFLLDQVRFDEPTFSAWVEAAEAVAIPGALDFARRAAESGVTLFYVSNRDAHEEAGTRRNLERLGFPLRSDRDVVLSRGERPEWGSDKESRRREVARDHRVLLLLGDDLNDFLSGVRESDGATRRRLADTASEKWGRSWFLLPNPLYGSWERAIVGANPGSKPIGEVRARKRASLRGFEGSLSDPDPEP